MMKIIPPYTDFSQALPRRLSDMIQAACNHFLIDKTLALPAVLGIFASLVHDKFMVEVHDHVSNASFTEPLSLFCIGIAGSSERKTPLLKWLKVPLLESLERINMQKDAKKLEQLCEKRLAEDEVKKVRRKISSLSPESPQRKLKMERLVELEQMLQQKEIEPIRLFLQDTSAIAAADFMQKQTGSSFTIADAEGISFDAILSDHRLLELLLSSFSNEAISYERSSRPSVEIKSPHANVCILTQAVKLQRLTSKKSTWDEGFVPRSLIFLAREMAGTRNTAIGQAIPHSIQQWWEDKSETFLTMPYQQDELGNRSYYVLDLSDDAARLWQRFSIHLECMMQEGTATYPLRAWLGKMGGVVARVAAIFHLFEEEDSHNMTISGLHMQMACNLILAVRPHMSEVAKLYFPVDETVNNAVHKIVNWLKQQRGTLYFFKLREMYRELNISSKIAFIACINLSHLGVLYQSIMVEQKIGRNVSPTFHVNYPILEQQFPLLQY